MRFDLFFFILFSVVVNYDADKNVEGGTLIDDGGGKSFGKEIMLTV